MNAEDIYEEWTEGEQNGMRPKRVQAIRGDLQDALGIPVPHRISEIESWLDSMTSSGVITKKLQSASEGSDRGEEKSEGSGDEEGGN